MLEIEPRKLTQYVETYLSTAGWAATDEDENSIAHIWFYHKLAPGEFDKIGDFITRFLDHEQIRPIIATGIDPDCIINDLYLARNGYFAYFDGLAHYGILIDEKTRYILIDVARTFGRSKPYVGSDDMIYFS